MGKRLVAVALAAALAGPGGPAAERAWVEEDARAGGAWAEDTAARPSAVVRPVDGKVVAVFDPPEAPWEPGTRGVRLQASPGQPARAALDGTVAFAGEVAGAGWVTVAHGGGLDTTYGEVEPAVAAGRRVRAGDVVGWVADDRDHLHWGARLDGDYLDPLSLLRAWRPRLVAPRRLSPGKPRAGPAAAILRPRRRSLAAPEGCILGA